MEFFKTVLKKIKLFVLFWRRIVFAKNNFDVNFYAKLKCNFCGGFLADQYVLYDLKNRNRGEYLSEFDWYRSRYINEPFDFAFNNKVVCAEILKQYVHVAENYFIKNKGIIYDFEKGRTNTENIISLLSEKGKLIIKPFALGKGQGVHLLSYENGVYSIDGESAGFEGISALLNKENGYIICEFIKQHSYVGEIFDKTANTIRMITMRDIYTAENRIFFAVQRIGTEATIPVDNGSRGGLISKIDLDTGRLSAAKSLHNLNTYEKHPDTGMAIEGVCVPGWESLKSEILKVADKVPYMEFIAWDLLVTNDGFCVIEANNSSGVNIIQLWGGQRNGELGEFYRHYKVIK